MNTFAIPAPLIDAWRTTLETLRNLTGLGFGLLTRENGGELEIMVTAGELPSPFSEGYCLKGGPEGPLCAVVHTLARSLLIPDTTADARWASNPAVKAGVRAYFGLPLRLPTGALFGTLCLGSMSPVTGHDAVLKPLHCFATLVEQHIALLSTNALLRSQLDALPGASFASDPHGQMLFASNRCGSLLDLHPADIPGSDVDTVFNRIAALCESPEECHAILRRSFTLGGPSNGKLAFDDGRTIRWQARRLREDAGSVLGCTWFLEDATAELQARAGLTRSEALFRGLFNNAAVGIVLLDRQGFVVRSNVACARMLGTSPEQMHGLSFRAVLPPEDADQHLEEMQSLAEGETDELHGCWEMLHRNGSRLRVDLHGARLPGSGEEVVMLVGVDVTEQWRTERALAESERRYRALFDNAQAGIFRTSLADGTFLEANLRMAQMFGYDDVATFMAEYRAAENYVDPADRALMLDRLRTSGSFATMETHMRRRDGTTTWFLYSGTLDGDTIIGVANEISEMRATQEALRRSEERYRALFDNAADGLLLYEADGTLIDVNETIARRLGESREAIVGRNVASIVEPEVLERVRPRLAEILETGHASFESVHRTAMGPVNVEVHARRIEFEGRFVVLSSARDITERKNLEAALLREATTDPLTGVRNRRQFFVDANREFARALRHDSGLAVLMLDIDHFKNVNDLYGHQAGDEVLRAFAACCVEALRAYDVFGRLGGEEFAALLPAASPEEAMETAERLRKRVERRSVVYEGTALQCTVSVGVTSLAAADLGFDDMLRRADRALYAAKDHGRNRSEMAPMPMVPAEIPPPRKPFRE